MKSMQQPCKDSLNGALEQDSSKIPASSPYWMVVNFLRHMEPIYPSKGKAFLPSGNTAWSWPESLLLFYWDTSDQP